MRLPSQRERWEATAALPGHETPRTGLGAAPGDHRQWPARALPLLRHKQAIADAEAWEHAHAHRERLARSHRPIPYGLIASSGKNHTNRVWDRREK